MDILAYNRQAWDSQVAKKDKWTVPVDAATVARARQGDWQIVLTPLKPVPRDWFPASLKGMEVLCLAAGGGQQGPVLAAAGAAVTVFDNSPAQLARDSEVADRDGLDIATVQGDMRDLSCFASGTFDLVVHPVANVFVDDVRPVWREAARVLKPGGTLLSGFFNPLAFVFDMRAYENGKLDVRHAIPYADHRDLDETDYRELILDRNWPTCFGHSLADLVGGQCEAGLAVTGFYEDKFGDGGPLDQYIDIFIATRAVKPR